jgi:hypothetical protein
LRTKPARQTANTVPVQDNRNDASMGNSHGLAQSGRSALQKFQRSYEYDDIDGARPEREPMCIAQQKRE